jgi:histidine triad (HIT) family protein
MLDIKEEHQAVLGKMMVMAPKLAREQGLENGFRTIINTGKIGRQEVPHLHMHIIGGPNVLPGMISRN